MLVLMGVLLSVIVIGNVSEFRADGNNAATQGALGNIRSKIKEHHKTMGAYPTLSELRASPIPKNPWSLDFGEEKNTIFDCETLTPPATKSESNEKGMGWCYQPSTGVFWANSTRNGLKVTENQY